MKRLLKGGIGGRRRLTHTVVATALAVSLLVGTLIFTDTVRSAFRSASRAQAGSADLMVRTTAEFAAGGTTVLERAPVPASLVADVERVPGVRSAWGMVWGFAQPVDDQGRSLAPEGRPTMGTGWSPDIALAAGRAPSGPDGVAIDADAADRSGVTVGDQVKIVFENSVATYTVRGLVDPGGSVAPLVAFDPPTAQERFGEGDGFNAIAVRADRRPAGEALRARIGSAVAGTYEVVGAEQMAAEARDAWTRALGFLEVALLAFAAVAFLVGGFVIANTFTILVAQRARQLALLRALGASRRQVMATVLVEALLVGSVASALGIVAGLVTARGLVAMLARIGLDLGRMPVVFLPRTALAALLCGVVVTTTASLLPAWRATRVSAATGIAGLSAEGTAGLRRRGWIGSGSVLAGIALLMAGLFSPLQPRAAVIGLGGAVVLVGVAAVVPLLALVAARMIGGPLVRLFGPSAALGRENAMRNPRRTGATAAALTIGIALVGVVGILGASMQASARRAVTDTLRADLVVKVKGNEALNGGIPPVAAARLRDTTGVDVVSEFRAGPWGLDGQAQTLLALDPATLATVSELDAEARTAAARLRPQTVLVREGTAARHGWNVGDTVPMTFARTGTQNLELVGTFSSPSPTDYVVSLATYEANFAQQRDSEIRVRLTPGMSVRSARAAVEASLADFPTLTVMDKSEVLATQQEQVDKVLMPVVGLLGLSVLIALVGIANTLALSVHERTREIGLLRSIGMARGQLRAMIRSEAVIIAGLGSLLGVAVAALLGWALVVAMRGVGMTVLVVPVRQLAVWVAAAIVAGMMAAILPARKAASVSALEAVGTPLG